jgi:RNA polymerase sigma factor (sigma-70 family)
VRGAQAGSVSDLEALFRTHWGRAFRAAYLVTRDAAAAEDIAQESLLAALRALDRFDRRRPFGPWLHRIVVNRAIDWVRARQLRGEVELDETVPGPVAPEADDAPRLAAAIAALPPEQRSRRGEANEPDRDRDLASPQKDPRLSPTIHRPDEPSSLPSRPRSWQRSGKSVYAPPANLDSPAFIAVISRTHLRTDRRLLRRRVSGSKRAANV